MLPVPFIILYIRHIFHWLKKRSPWWQEKITALEKKAHLKGRLVHKYSAIGLCILVAIPFPIKMDMIVFNLYHPRENMNKKQKRQLDQGTVWSMLRFISSNLDGTYLALSMPYEQRPIDPANTAVSIGRCVFQSK